MRQFRNPTLACIVLASLLSCRRETEPADTTSGPAPVEAATSSPGSTNLQTSADASTSSDATISSKAMSESEKIEALIAALGKLEGATFLRNGKGYGVDEAIAHMRMKWKWKASEITTAEDFIRIAATKSSSSGKGYVIILEGGEEIASAEWFQAQLQQIDGRH